MSGDDSDLPVTPEALEEAEGDSLLSARTKRVLAVAVLVLGLALAAPPAFGDGPDADTVYTYEAVPVDPDGRSVGVLVDLPEATYVYGDVAEAVVSAENETYERTTAEAGTRRLVDTLEPVRFVRESGQGRFYRVDLTVDGRTIRLDSDRVDGETLVSALAVSPSEAPDRVRSLYESASAGGDTQLATKRPVTPTLLDTPEGYVAVVTVGQETRPDPRATEKVLMLALGLVLTFAGAVAYTRV
ncbi:hypothetical protein N0B31_15550 [Salinirubellus salinus]|uniref:Uncharacterized protein n=1 Tax=Salinirubellus salinus TaxID=1364945 RepID=A0A9E7R0Z4_9EURY|nr:hypothetical protein [Salinirubellus salinus]UWM53548.1 hypothetical protein N0B31_15550 [Salinirubellus salinus]